jgi:hypothetical protein
MYLELSKPDTWAPNFVAYSDVSKDVISRTPAVPLRAAFQKLLAPTPMGDTTPMPVTTTRLTGSPMYRESKTRAVSAATA